MNARTSPKHTDIDLISEDVSHKSFKLDEHSAIIYQKSDLELIAVDQDDQIINKNKNYSDVTSNRNTILSNAKPANIDFNINEIDAADFVKYALSRIFLQDHEDTTAIRM